METHDPRLDPQGPEPPNRLAPLPLSSKPFPGLNPLPGPAPLTSRAIWFSASSSAVSRSRLGSRLRPEPCVPMSIGRPSLDPAPRAPPPRPSLRRGVMASAGRGDGNVGPG